MAIGGPGDLERQLSDRCDFARQHIDQGGRGAAEVRDDRGREFGEGAPAARAARDSWVHHQWHGLGQEPQPGDQPGSVRQRSLVEEAFEKQIVPRLERRGHSHHCDVRVRWISRPPRPAEQLPRRSVPRCRPSVRPRCQFPGDTPRAPRGQRQHWPAVHHLVEQQNRRLRLSPMPRGVEGLRADDPLGLVLVHERIVEQARAGTSPVQQSPGRLIDPLLTQSPLIRSPPAAARGTIRRRTGRRPRRES